MPQTSGERVLPLSLLPKGDQPFGPEGTWIFDGKSGQGEANEGDHHHQVDEPVEDIKPPVDAEYRKVDFLSPPSPQSLFFNHSWTFLRVQTNV